MPHKWKRIPNEEINGIYRCDNCHQQVYMSHQKPHALMPVLVKKDGSSSSDWKFCEDIIIDEVHQT